MARAPGSGALVPVGRVDAADSARLAGALGAAGSASPAGARVRTEVCVESLAGVRIAIDAGADRVELCAALNLDGLTPPADLIERAVEVAAGTGLAIHVLIRCRPGDFVYDQAEVALMTQQLREAIGAGADGVVIGALGPDGLLDVAALGRWMAAARGGSDSRAFGQSPGRDPDSGPKIGDSAVRATGFNHGASATVPAITFHRAFDRVFDPLAALSELASAGVDRVLTSGQAPTAPDGADLLAQLVSRAAELSSDTRTDTRTHTGTGTGPKSLTMLAGGGIRPDNVAALIGRTGVTEVHFSGRRNGAIDAGVVRSTIAAARATDRE